ncbi:MAG: TerC family protein [Candidatus Omnitrophota bacterium]
MTIWLWIGFIVFVLFMMALDLGVLNRKAHAIGIKEALGWTSFWVSLALLFNVGIYFIYENHWLGIGEGAGHVSDGKTAALYFFTAYIVEESLSLDNLFVFTLIFSYFQIPPMYQHRVLFWGILGVLILRGIMIAAGVVLIQRFDWIIYVFGAILLFTAFKMLIHQHDKINPEKNILYRLAKKLYPITPHLEGNHFFSTLNGRRAITPMFLVLILVESSDVLFAVDSIPAVFAVTSDPFIVFTSNVFAILGLRSLYFAIAAILNRFRYLKICLVILLAYVGVKMLLSHHYPIPAHISLMVIGGILGTGILASILVSKREAKQLEIPFSHEN